MIVRKSSLAVDVHALLIAKFQSVRKAAAFLGIPEGRLYSAFQTGNLDKLHLGDIQKISPLMREEMLNDIREYYLP